MSAPTFPNIPPDQSSPGEDVKYRTRRSKFGDGFEQAVIDGINATEVTWKISFDNLNTVAVEQIVAFLDGRGGAKPFWWTPPVPQATAPSLWTCEERSRSDYRANSSTLRCTFVRWYGAEE